MIRTLTALAALPILLVSCAADGFHLSIRNETGADLYHAPVVSSPPPPHRVVSTTQVPAGLRFEIATDDFNPVFFDKSSRLGVHVQFDWETDPPPVFVRVFQYVVAPGLEGDDPALQPTKLSEAFYEVDTSSEKRNVEIKAGPISSQIPITFQQF